MVKYLITVTFVDEINGETTRSYEGDFVDDATANTKAGDLLTDIIPFTGADLSAKLTKTLPVVASASAGSRVFENARLAVQLDDTQKYSLDFPAPVPAVFVGNAVDVTNTLVTDFIANFATGEWEVSDGQAIDSILSGKRVFRSSGKTNLQ